jgi:hypothetical protein
MHSDTDLEDIDITAPTGREVLIEVHPHLVLAPPIRSGSITAHAANSGLGDAFRKRRVRSFADATPPCPGHGTIQSSLIVRY